MKTEEMIVQYINPSTLKVNDYSRNLFPELKGDAYKILKSDIQENGIRTPIEITDEMLILCGHERQKIALELGLKKVPIIYFHDGDDISQKQRIIKDNLARKNVDFRTKMRCYEELKRLYGLKRESHVKRGKDGKYTPERSEEASGKLSEDQIAKEVGFSNATFERAKTIEQSDLPEQIKNAAFNGRLSIRPVADLAHETNEVKDKVVPQVLKKLEDGDDKFSVETLTRDTKQEFEVQRALKEIGVPSVEEQVKGFYGKLSPLAPNRKDRVSRQEMIQHITGFIERQALKCPICGEQHIQWKCGHEFK
jgi:ParB-like chromosome segregation protein Spo0J